MKPRIILIGSLFAVSVLLLAAQKFAFLAYYHNLIEVADWPSVGLLLRRIWQADVPVVVAMLGLPLAVLFGSLWTNRSARCWRSVIYGYLACFSVLSAAAFAVDLGLYGHWGFKLTTLVFAYLSDWRTLSVALDGREVAGVALFFVADLVLMLGGYWLVVRHANFDTLSSRMRLVGSVMLAALFGFSVYVGCNLRTIYPTREGASQKRFVNHAAANPLTTLLRSITRSRCLEDLGRFYAEPERAARFDSLRSTAACPPPQMLTTQRPNIVLIVCESFSREFMDKTDDGRPVMPNLQRLKTEGIWFENMYASSFRTDRALVAILNGFPAQPNHSLMRMQSKTSHLPSLARTLADYGYRSSVLYGGNLNFTQMAAYFRATQWEQICSQRDLSHLDAEPSHWGYDDATVGQFFVDQLTEASDRHEPFLATWLTLSSHEPFDVPQRTFKSRRLNAMAFADAAIGRVVDSLHASPVWDNLLVILVADHTLNDPIFGAHDSPQGHHIPMIWTGGAVRQATSVDTYLCQTDLAATLLGQMNIDSRDFPFSHDRLAADQSDAFAYYTYVGGFCVIDRKGYTRYEVSTDAVHGTPDADSVRRTERGKTILQSTYHVIDAL